MKLRSFLLLCLLSFGGLAYTQSGENSREITLESDGVKLSGTLMIPVAKKKPPVVLIIAGSGPTDRDGNNPMMKNNSLKLLAESLYSEGIASLRYDKRMIGASAAPEMKESDLRFEQFINDAAAWVNWLQQEGSFSKIIVAGHSEGSLIGMVAARKAGADAFISLAGAGAAADVILRNQLANQPDYVTDIAYPILDSLKAGKMVADVSPMLAALFRADVQPYLISWFQYDPKAEIALLDMPVLVVQGTTDIQVSEDNARTLAAAKPGAKLVVIKGMNHIFKLADSNLEKNIATYSKPDLPLAPELPAAVVKFVEKMK